MSPEELAAFVSTLAIAISREKTTDELTVLGAIFTQLADTLLTIAAQRQFIESNSCTDDEQ